jgi:hypothetical protein
MGTVLILLGLTPGLLERCAEAMAAFSNMLLFRFPARNTSHRPIAQPRWLAALGAMIVVLAAVAYYLR